MDRRSRAGVTEQSN